MIKGKMNKKGFTLIELLVVVLIIGILAAVGLPQYQRVVEKSRAGTVLPMVKAMSDAQERHHLQHDGTYASEFADLDIELDSLLNDPGLDASSDASNIILNKGNSTTTYSLSNTDPIVSVVRTKAGDPTFEYQVFQGGYLYCVVDAGGAHESINKSICSSGTQDASAGANYYRM